jgi:hypothetical protein
MSSRAWDFSNERATFRPDNQNIPSRVHVPIMRSSAVRTGPMSYCQPANTSRFCAAASRAAARAGLRSPTLGDDFAFAAKRNRFVRQHVAQHSPTRVPHRFCHVGFCDFKGTDISDVNLRVITHNLGGENVEEVISPIGDLSVKCSRTNLLAPRPEKRKFGFLRPIMPRCSYFFASRESSKYFQTQINTDCRTGSLLRIRQFHYNIDIPTTSGISRKVPAFRLAIFRQRARVPYAILSLAEYQRSIIKLYACKNESCYGNPVQIPLITTETWRFWERCFASVSEFLANSVYSVGMQSEFFGHTATKIAEIKSCWSSYVSASLPSIGGLAVDLAAIIPDEINRTSLSAERSARRRTSVFNSVAVCEKHVAGRLSGYADGRSRAAYGGSNTVAARLYMQINCCAIPYDEAPREAKFIPVKRI